MRRTIVEGLGDQGGGQAQEAGMGFSALCG